MSDEKSILNQYPRPQFVRNEWLNLNGQWNFAFDDNNTGEKDEWYKREELDLKILVPFVYESKASGIHDESHHPYVWYQRTVDIDTKYSGKRIIINFQGTDYITKLWINGKYIGNHQGSGSKFKFDITNFVNIGTVNNIVVKIEDTNSCCQPRGKQRWLDENFGCWYVQSTGIWKTVWMEFLNHSSIDRVKITTDIDNSSVDFEYFIDNFEASSDLKILAKISYNGKEVNEVLINAVKSKLKVTVDLIRDGYVEGIHMKVAIWDIGQPNLYDVKFILYSGTEILDEVDSYFGMRKVSINKGRVLLNNGEIYQKLLLDQGYWKDTLLTPPSDEAIIEDIDKTIAMGFNGVRKHMKIEDERYLYWCDKKGVLVWSEMAATYEYSDEAIHNFVPEWIDIVEQNYNHPCIVTWVPVNESWGVPNILVNKQQQNFTEALYYITKSLDQTRPVVVNDGWEHTISDILTIHDYEEFENVFADRYSKKERLVNDEVVNVSRRYNFAEGHKYKGQPIIISEYGGIAFKSDSGWGYGNQVSSEEAFLKRYKGITDAIKKVEYICGFCYTQIADVQQEINGLLTEDRVPKIDMEKIKEINDARP